MRWNQRLAPVLTWVVRLAIVFLILSQIAPLAHGQATCPPATPAAKISPVAATVLPSGTVQFRSIGVSDPIVWSVNDNPGGSPEIGTISRDGLYTAPQSVTVASVTVRILSSNDKKIIDSAQVFIGRQAISLAPLAATLAANTGLDLNASALNGMKEPFIWQVNGVYKGNDGFGTITNENNAKAHYTAPKDTNTASTVTVTLLSADCKFSASTAIVIVQPSLPIEKSVEIVLKKNLNPYKDINPRISSVPLKPGEQIQLAATSPNSGPIPVVWTATADTNNAGATGQFEKTTDTTTTYQAPSESEAASIPITITAAPKAADYPSASIKVFVMKQALARCSSVKVATTSPLCKVTDFNRLKGETGEFPIVARAEEGKWMLDPSTDAGVVTAINASKTIFSGSVLDVKLTDGANGFNCANYDWKIVVQSKEATSVLIYDPSDVGSGVCEGDRFIIALPVHVLWADVYGYRQNLDPSRAAPAKPSSFTDCVGQPAIQAITPCDVGTSRLVAGGYHAEWWLSHFSAPGNGKGTITFTGKGEVIYDVQADPAYKAGIGWFNVPVVFERGPAGANLNSLTFGVAYDFRPVAHPNWNWGKPGATSHFIFRKPQFQISSGPEMSPSRPGTASTTGNEHSWNYVWGETVKFPLVLNFHDQPSSFSFYSIFGAEEGWHVATNLPANDPIARGLAGANVSFRWPFNVTHNFLGTTPITFEAQYLVRWLAYPEPFADFANLPPAGTPPPCPPRVGIGVITSSTGQLTCGAVEVLSSKAQSLFRGDISFPLDPYIQVTASVTKGSLPPSFWLIGWTYSLGLTFGNNASSEH